MSLLFFPIFNGQSPVEKCSKSVAEKEKKRNIYLQTGFFWRTDRRCRVDRAHCTAKKAKTEQRRNEGMRKGRDEKRESGPFVPSIRTRPPL